MPEPDEKRELGGLAQSIDALFSQTVRAPAVEAPEPEALETALAEEEREVEPALVEAPGEPDPFESLDARVDEPDGPDERGAPSPAEVEVPEEVAREGLEPETSAAADALELAETPGAEDEAWSEPVQAPSDDTAPEAAGAGLGDAVEAFLSGSPGAADEVRALAAGLQERLTLDPLADAVERLVHAGEGAPNADALALAREVINPAVASRLVQRMGHEEDEAKRATYGLLSERLGMVMANAFRGALTASTDARVRRAYYDGLIAMGDTSRSVIEAMIEDDNRFLVRNAVALLGEIGGEGAIGLVTSTLANTDARVRCEALASMAKLGGEESGQLVLASLEDPDSKVRAAAAVAAGELGLERALKPILGVLDSADDSTDLVSVLHGLGRLGDPGAVQAIEKRAVTSLFSKPPTEVRVAAYRALHAIGTPHARELIDRARDDKDPVVRTTVRGLERLHQPEDVA